MPTAVLLEWVEQEADYQGMTIADLAKKCRMDEEELILCLCGYEELTPELVERIHKNTCLSRSAIITLWRRTAGLEKAPETELKKGWNKITSSMSEHNKVIRGLMNEKGLFPKNIREDLGVSSAFVTRVLAGDKVSERFDKWCIENLDLDPKPLRKNDTDKIWRSFKEKIRNGQLKGAVREVAKETGLSERAVKIRLGKILNEPGVMTGLFGELKKTRANIVKLVETGISHTTIAEYFDCPVYFIVKAYQYEQSTERRNNAS